MLSLDSLVQLFCTVNSTGFFIVASLLFVADSFATYFIIQRVPYTEIDWSTYMQQVECFVKQNIRNYSLIEGDTGPVVYPAGHLYVYRVLYSLTNNGKDIEAGQYFFYFFYLLNLVLVFRLYYKSRKVPPFVLVFLCCTGYRIHSIFVLRLFNDPVAMMFFYMAANLFISHQWFLGCVLYSFAVSIKMNVLLFAPALFFILLLNNGFGKTIFLLTICALTQIYIGLTFLSFDPYAYIIRSFDLGRVFLFKWTVNWRFLPEQLFLHQYFHVSLLLLHVFGVAIFGYYLWFRSHGGLRASLVELRHGIRTRIGVHETLFALFTSNLVGIACARSLHYQFYSWYFHQLPFLLFWNFPSIKSFSEFPFKSTAFKALLLLAIEYSWNVYPSTVLSSALLHVVHLTIVLHLIFNRIERYKRKLKLT